MAFITGYIVNTDVPEIQRYQFYEGVGGSTTLEINVAGDLSRSGYLGYVSNNAVNDVYLHINYTLDSGDTMRKIKIPSKSVFNLSPANITVDSLEFTSDGIINIDVIVH